MTQRMKIATEQDAPEPTKEILAQLKRAVGMIPNVYAAIGQSPGSLASVLGWGEAVSKGGLKSREIEQLNLHISELNGCAYCICAHTALGGRAGLTQEEIASARSGLGTSDRENALLAFARRVVRTGGSRAGTELVRLREAGVSDADIVDTLAVIALNTFRNAINIVGEVPIDFPAAPRLPSN